ncbi:MAG: hypothetical protein IKB38_02510 [Clostridia bacterium]|nr:hypothetical protein [Clostridia bacterium]
METKQKKERTLKDFIEILLPKLWLIALVAIVFAMTVFTYCYTRVDTYTSSARFLVTYEGQEAGTMLYEPDIVEGDINVFAQIVKGDDFCNDVVLAVNADPHCAQDIDKAQFQSMFNFSAGNRDQTFSFSIVHTDPNEAYNIANVVKEILLQEIDTNKESKSNQTVKTISEPQLRTVPNSKNSARNAIIAFAAGAIATACVVLVVALSDVTIRDKKKIEDNFNIPVLGVIPYHDISVSTSSSDAYGGQNKNVV